MKEAEAFDRTSAFFDNLTASTKATKAQVDCIGVLKRFLDLVSFRHNSIEFLTLAEVVDRISAFFDNMTASSLASTASELNYES